MVEKALDLSKTKGKVSYEKLDIGNMQSVHQFAGRIKQKHSKIDILINNGKKERKYDNYIFIACTCVSLHKCLL